MRNNNQLQTVSLQENIRLHFQNICEKVLKISDHPTAWELIRIAGDMAKVLKKDSRILKAMKRLASGKTDYVLFDNMSVDSKLCSTPVNGLRPDDKLTWTSEMTLLALMLMADLSPFSYREEKGDDLIHQIAPAKDMEETRSNAGKIPLDWHTDNSILQDAFRLDFLGLLGLVNEANTSTKIASVAEALKLLSERQRRVLTEDLFRLKTPDSFDKAFNNMKIVSEWRPIIKTDSKGRLIAAGNVYAIEYRNESARAALHELNEALTEVSQDVILRPGVCLIFNNNSVFHSRSEIKGDRWLQRVFAKDNLDMIRKAASMTMKDYIVSVKALIL